MKAPTQPSPEAEPVPLLLRKSVIGGLVALFLLAVGLYIAVAMIFDISFALDASGFQEWVDQFGPLGPLLFIGALAAAVLFAPIPNLPILIAAGLAWGPLLGTVYSLAGLTIGSAVAFQVSRWAGRRHLARLVGTRTAERIDRATSRYGGTLVFWARLLPATNFDWISFAAGMTSIRFRTFTLYSTLGMAPPTLLTVAAGDSLGRDFRLTIVLIGVWLLGVVSSAAYFWHRRRSR